MKINSIPKILKPYYENGTCYFSIYAIPKMYISINCVPKLERIEMINIPFIMLFQNPIPSFLLQYPLLF